MKNIEYLSTLPTEELVDKYNKIIEKYHLITESLGLETVVYQPVYQNAQTVSRELTSRFINKLSDEEVVNFYPMLIESIAQKELTAFYESKLNKIGVFTE